MLPLQTTTSPLSGNVQESVLTWPARQWQVSCSKRGSSHFAPTPLIRLQLASTTREGNHEVSSNPAVCALPQLCSKRTRYGNVLLAIPACYTPGRTWSEKTLTSQGAASSVCSPMTMSPNCVRRREWWKSSGKSIRNCEYQIIKWYNIIHNDIHSCSFFDLQCEGIMISMQNDVIIYCLYKYPRSSTESII